MVQWVMQWTFSSIRNRKGRVGKWKVIVLKYVSYSSKESNGESNHGNGEPGIVELKTYFCLQILRWLASFSLQPI